jgi:hypothetical protein
MKILQRQIEVPAMLLACSLHLSAFITPASADAISDWTARGQAIVMEQCKSALSCAHTLAALHIAMFEAINAADRSEREHRTSREAASATAAHDVLAAFYPDRGPDLSPALAASLSAIENDVPKARGLAVGRQIAGEVLARWARPRRQIGEVLGEMCP